ncbi:MAG: carbohydrate ABC transporter permease [Spirochaetales bacterium]|nr:carbohydrate ABC transporter permease [Spirochaetales bacterium]
MNKVQSKGSGRPGTFLLGLGRYGGLGIFAFLFVFPFYYVFVLATHRVPFANPPHLFFGPSVAENFDALFRQIPFLQSFGNSLGIAVLATASVIFFCTLGGFAFAKYDFKGKEALLVFVVMTMAIPPFLNIIPFFRMMVAFGWYQTWLPLIVPGMANAFGIFLMKQFLEESIPGELMDAARIDGLNEFQLLPAVVFPLAKPGIAILGTLTFVGSWNNFLGALVMLPDPRNSTLPVSLSSLFVRSDGNYGGLMLGTALSILPLVVIFIFFSKKIIANLAAGAVKG